MAACRSTSEWKLPRRMRLRVSTEKKFSTAFSYEPEVGAKWNVQRGCRSTAILIGCLAALASPCELGLDVGRRF